MSRKNNKNSKKYILVRGARVNNLKNINIDIPKDKLVVVTGLSGSGKSSLAFDTIFVEGNRRYLEGMSSYARSFLDIASKPDVDSIENLSPPISIDQKSVRRSPRSTVGTLTEIYDYLRLLFAYIGEPHCPDCNAVMRKKTNKEIVAEILKFSHRSRVIILSRFLNDKKSAKEKLKQIQQAGYARVRWQNKLITLEEAFSLEIKESLDENANVEIVIDRITLDKKNPDEERMEDSIETAMKVSNGSVIILVDGKNEKQYNRDFVCRDCGIRIKDITPRHFSFNNPEGACEECSGLGVKMKIDADRIILNRNLSLAEGALKPWGSITSKTTSSRNGANLVKKLAQRLRFSLNTPIKKLTQKNLNAILYGGVEKVPEFKGIVHTMEGKYASTKSEHIRGEIEKYMTMEECNYCQGRRLKKEFLNVLINGKSISDYVEADVFSLIKELENLVKIYGDKISKALLREILERLKILENVGLGYLSLSRSTQTISGGEAQRIRLTAQIKSKLTGIIYVLDEPSIGLHSQDNQRLINTIKSLRDEGNSVLVVEHDREFIKAADWVIDMGKGAGQDGGKVIFEGTVKKLMSNKNRTAQYINGQKSVAEKTKALGASDKFLEVVGAKENNLKNITVQIPLERMVVVCGVSGSGKSTLVNDILAHALNKHFYNSKVKAGQHKKIKGLRKVNKVVNVTQSPIGRTPRSNAATYTGIFSYIREIFAETEESRKRNYPASRFSFNMKGGRCEVCQGEGKKKIEMNFLADMYVKCDACEGTRYNKKTLEIEYQGVNIAEILQMSVSYARAFFHKHSLIVEKLKIMEEVGLGYLKLGQSAVELSGGEAQRIKLATELSRKSTGKTMYILDEPTVGLHFDDIRKLLNVCNILVEKGNTVLIVEHNEDVIKGADWVIELGPEGGQKGGEIIFTGTPAELKKCKTSPTAKFL